MPGDPWRRFANLRTLFAYMWTHPGKKLLFMGGELGQDSEWSHDAEIPWGRLEAPEHAGVQRLVRDLNRLYGAEPALHELDAEGAGFRWLVGDDADQSVFAYLRVARDGAPVLVALNLTPEPRPGYRLGVPVGGRWRELLNTDSALYGGGDLGNGGGVEAVPEPWGGQPCGLDLMIPPLGAVILKPDATA
jgi:1,4-alpha-glucan branching enzyme